MKLRTFVIYVAFGLIISCALFFIQCSESAPRQALEKDNTNNTLRDDVYKWSTQTGLPDSALTYIEKFYEISVQKTNYEDVSVALKARYNYFSSRNNFAETYKSAQERLNIAEQANDSTLLYDAMYAVGRLHFSQGTFLDALDYFLQLANMNNISTNQRATILYTLGQTYTMIYSSDDKGQNMASHYYELAKEETKKTDFTRQEMKGFIAFGEGMLYLSMEDKDLFEFTELEPVRIDSLNKAVALLEEANIYFKDKGHINHCALALAYALLGNYTKSYVFEAKAIDEAKTTPDWFSTVNYTSSLIRFRQKKFSEAINIASEGYKVSIANGKQSDGSKNAKVLCLSSAALADYANAYKYHRIMSALHKSMDQAEKQNQMMVYQVKYDTKIKEEQLDNERKRNEVYLRYIKQIVVFSFILLIIAGVFIYLYKQKQRAYRLLVIKNSQWAENNNPESIAEIETRGEDLDSDEAVNEESIEPELDAVKLEELQAIMQKVYEKIISEKLYTDKNLSLEILAQHLGTNKSYLSRAINTITNKNFKSFISTYRVKEAIKLIKKEPHDKPLDMIADECGFNDRSTFYRSFKKITGLSPSVFRNNL